MTDARLAAGLCVVAMLLAALTACASGARHVGPVSDHFDGERFHNEAPFDLGWRDLWRYYREREPGVWTRDLTPPNHPDPVARVGAGELQVTVINHATVLIQIDGLNLLTDPIWSARASPFQRFGPQRYVAPGLAFAQLPPIDAVLISHDHFDHLDLPTLRRLEAEHQPRFIVTRGCATKGCAMSWRWTGGRPTPSMNASRCTGSAPSTGPAAVSARGNATAACGWPM